MDGLSMVESLLIRRAFYAGTGSKYFPRLTTAEALSKCLYWANLIPALY